MSNETTEMQNIEEKKIEKPKQEEYCIVLIGSGGVGKTSVTLSFVKNTFSEKYDPTIEDAYTKIIQVDGKNVKLNILDTAGQEEFTAMRDQYMREGAGFIFVYDITDPSSFQEMEQIYEQLLQNRNGEESPILLVGNKCDLKDQRAVSTDEGNNLKEEFGEYCTFLEVSAKMRINVDEVFEEMGMIGNEEQMKPEKIKMEKPIKKRKKGLCNCSVLVDVEDVEIKI